MTLLPGTRKKFMEWRSKGYTIILATGRPLSREHTVHQLAQAGIPYDLLVMGVGGGKRVLINDKKPDGSLTAAAYNLERNVGIADINE